MPKKTAKTKKVYRAIVGGNYANGERFEAGQIIDCDEKELKTLIAMNAVAEEK